MNGKFEEHLQEGKTLGVQLSTDPLINDDFVTVKHWLNHKPHSNHSFEPVQSGQFRTSKSLELQHNTTLRTLRVTTHNRISR